MSRRGVPAIAVLGAVLALELAALYVVMHNSSWVFDDNYFLVLAGQEGFTWHWLTSVQFEHWDIALHAIVSVQHRLFFLDYRWGLAALLAVLAAAIVVFERTLATILPDRRVTLAISAWFGLSILWARPLQWFIAGTQYLPYTLLDLVCLYAFLRWHADRRTRWAVASVLALAAALLFYEKPAYMLLYLLLLRVLLMSTDLRPRAVLAGLWSERGLWAGYLAVVAVWGAGYLHSGAYSSHGAVSLSQYASYFRILWLQTLVPSLAGVTIPAANLSSLQTLFVVLSQLAVLACVGVSLLLRRSAWRAWAFLAIAIVANGVLVAHSRIPIFGVNIANDPRYLIDYSWLVPVALCAAFSRGGVLRPTAPEPLRGVRVSARGAVVAVVGAVLAVYAAGAVASAHHLERLWAGPQGRTWETNVRAGFAAREHARQSGVVLESATPFQILSAWTAPYNRLSGVLPLYVGKVQVDGPLDAPLLRVAPDGRVHEVATRPVAAEAAPWGLLGAHKLTVTGGRVVRSGSALCVVADAGQAVVERRLDTTLDPAKGPYYALVGYRVWRPTAIGVSADTGAGPPAGPLAAVSLEPATPASIAWLGEGATRRVTLTIPPLTTVCLDGFAVVSTRDLD